MKEMVIVQTVLFDGGCEYMHLIQGESGIQYLLPEECPGSEGSSLDEHLRTN